MKLDKLSNYLKKFSKFKNKSSNKKIFFDILGAEVPGYIYNNILFLVTMNKLGYNVDYQIGQNQNNLKEVYSFNSDNFFILDRVKAIQFLPKIIYLNLVYCVKYFNIYKLFNLYIDGIYIGDLIYDDYNRREEQPSVDKINFKYFKKLNEAFLYYSYYSNIFKKNKYEFTVLNHNCYIRNALLGRVANKYGSNVMLVSGDYMGLLARKLYPNDNIFNFYSILNKDLFNKSFKNSILVEKAEKYFDNVMNKKVKTWDSVNFEVAKVNTDFQERKKVMSYKSSGKKIVVISSHILIDNIVGADGRRQVYRDILIWLEETLLLCEKNENIITFLKPHPREYAFKYTPTILDTYNKLNLKNVKLWPSQLDMKDNSDLIDVIITIRGSVSFEFPALGIPVVLAGKNHAGVSGFDTVLEVDKVDKYEEVIANIHTIDRLDEITIKKAKLIYFMYFNSIFYDINEKFSLKKDEFFESKYLTTDPKQLPENPYKSNIEDILIEKLKLFEESGEEYLNDWKLFLDDSRFNILGEVKYKKEFFDV